MLKLRAHRSLLRHWVVGWRSNGILLYLSAPVSFKRWLGGKLFLVDAAPILPAEACERSIAKLR